MTKPLANKQPRKATSGTRPKSTTPAGGQGYGGPAKGLPAERGARAAAFEPGNRAGVTTPDKPRDNRTPAEKRARMLAIYEEVAEDQSQPGMARINAADKWLDRHEGKPVARNITTYVDDATKLDDAALTAIAQGKEPETRH